VRPKPGAPVSAPVTWAEIEEGIRMEEFTINTMADRVSALGDLWAPVDSPIGRFDLTPLIPKKAGDRR
jgi:DNA primase